MIETWAPLCDRIVFSVDNASSAPPKRDEPSAGEHSQQDAVKAKQRHKWEPAPVSHLGFDFLRLDMHEPQSEEWRNIWEKSWRTWQHVGAHHLDDYDWFVKLDDDTFFSPINFKGFARFYNPEREWYMGNTLMHMWAVFNLVFNAGSGHALSRGALRRLLDVFESDPFLDPKRMDGPICTQRPGAAEDSSMGVCLHSIGIDPINTLDAQYRERFSIHRQDYLQSIKIRPDDDDDDWYFMWKAEELGMGLDCCAPHMITFHGYKHDRVAEMRALHARYNVEEGVDGKRLQVLKCSGDRTSDHPKHPLALKWQLLVGLRMGRVGTASTPLFLKVLPRTQAQRKSCASTA